MHAGVIYLFIKTPFLKFQSCTVDFIKAHLALKSCPLGHNAYRLFFCYVLILKGQKRVGNAQRFHQGSLTSVAGEEQALTVLGGIGGQKTQ